MDNLIRDLRYAFRGLRSSPGFTLVAVATLALGIGVNSTIFSIVNSLLLRPLPVERPAELVDVYGRPSNVGGHHSSSWLDYLDYRERAETLSGLMAWTNFFASFDNQGRAELIAGEVVSDNYFQVLGVQPMIGRPFSPEEFVTEGTHPVAILGHEFWSTRFARDPGVVGESVRLNGIVYTVIGVMPADFGGMMPGVMAQMWLPAMMVEEFEPLGNQRWGGGGGDTRLQQRGRRWLWMKGRMNPGVEIAQARAELEGIAAQLVAAYPDTNELETVIVLATNDVRINPDMDSAVAPAGAILLAVVGMVLLVACANLANMLLARAAARKREIAIRLAIGADRGRLVRQLLTESLMLALMGGLAGIVLAGWLSGLMMRYKPPLPIDFTLDASFDWRVFAFTLVASLATGVAFGLIPALRASRPDLVPALKDAGDGETRGRRFRLRDALVVAQVAVSIVLLVAGALLIRSLAAAQDVDFGYDTDRIAFLAAAMEMNGYDADQSAVFFKESKQRLQALPGVEAVGLTSRVAQSLNDNNFGVFIEGHQSASTDRPYVTPGSYVDEDYVNAMELTVVDGRAIEAADIDDDRRVVMVTEALATRYWPGESAVGQQFRRTWDGEPWEIVGVLADYKVNTPGELPTPYLHLPLPRNTVFGNFLVRTTGLAAGEVLNLERELLTIEPDLVFLDTGPMSKLAEVRLFPIRAGAWLIGAFGVLALLLAAIGLYGVIGYSVSRRTREIGIRMALGAETGRVVRVVLRQGMTLVLIGGLVGTLLAAAMARVLASFLFVSPMDLASFLIAFLVLAAVGLTANWLPARRAAHVDPMVALRSE